MLFTLILLLVTLAVSALVLSALLPTRVALAVGAALNTVQFYSISLFGIYPSLALLSWLSLWRTTLQSPLWRWPWMQALLALAAVHVVSLAWSPSPMVGIRHLIYFLPLPLAACGMYQLSSERPQAAERCLQLLLLGSVLEAALVVLFRISPTLEMAFLRRSLAQLFISANTLETLFDVGRNNVLDPAKAGGLFVNANIASAYLGVAALAAWYFGRYRGSALLQAVAVADWAAVLFTGSKAGLICALLVPAALAALAVSRSKRMNPISFAAALFGTAAAASVLILPFSQTLLLAYRGDASATLATREHIWHFGLQALRQHPLKGLGFGGWEQQFQQLPAFAQAAALVVPPHNSLLILWLQSGLAGVLAGIVVILAIYGAIARAFATKRTEMYWLAMASGGAFSWYVVQGMGENFGLTGEVHMTPLIGALLGHLCARHDGAWVTHETRIATPRSAIETSAIPAF
jgi:O-antigen ligase